MTIDLHVHTSEHSGCAVSSEAEQIEAAIACGLDAIAITDHDVLCDLTHIAALNGRYAPFKIFPGIEIRARNYFEDFIVLGIQDAELGKRSWHYEDLHAFVREKNGYILLCHPYRFHDKVPDAIFTHIPDAVEIHSTNIGGCDYDKIEALARHLNISTVTNSDAHQSEHVGIYYNILQGAANTEAELVTLLKTGAHTGGRDDKRIDIFNRRMGKTERLVKKFIRKGKDAQYFTQSTNMWHGYYDRVAMGKSYLLS